jgi:DNA gyrase subunit A
MEIGLVRKVNIDHEMQQSFLDYALSTIMARALPDARDGLKPVQRRILYAMYDMGLKPGSGYKKSARIVGEVLGKYHPHGDMAVYEAMARMAQDFSMRYMLVDGQGNFGSVDDDPPAAMRYTEAGLFPFAMELLTQIDRNTVDFVRNFDGTLEEPVVLPAALPNLLLNGASGIAVGMATNIPPHNLVELMDALNYMLSKWDHIEEITISDLMQYIQGPDFPTGGIILQESAENDLQTVYATGRGRVIVRGRVQLEEMGRGKDRIIITELPYLTNKSALIERIADLVRDGKLEGIVDVRDESDRHGIRVVIELARTATTETVLRELYSRTPLQSTFGMILLALVNGEPRLLTLKQALRVYLEHRIEVVKRRSEHDLERARQRIHIVEGLRIAINNLDEIITLIRRSPDVETARIRLVKRFKLSEIQANAILDMPLRRLSTLERKKIETEYKELQDLIKSLESLLHSSKKIRQVVETELTSLKETYNDRRRTQIISLRAGESAKQLLTTKSLMPAEDVWVGVSSDGIIARTRDDKLPRVSGKQASQWIMKTNTHQTMYAVAEDGKAASISIETLPEVEKFSDGILITKVSAFENPESLAAIFSIPSQDDIPEDRYVLTVTRSGLVKKTSIAELPGPSSQVYTLAKVNPEDALVRVLILDGESDILLVTAQGMMIRFSEQEVRPMGMLAAGVNGIKLAKDDYVIAAERITPGSEIGLLTTDGQGLRFSVDEIPVQGRYGQGVIATRLKKGMELAGVLLGKGTQVGIVHFHSSAARSLRLDEIILLKRSVASKDVLPVKRDDAIYYVTPIWDNLPIWKQREATPKKRKKEKEN